MSNKLESPDVIEIPIELERYEMFAAPTYRFKVARREFFKLFGGGVAIVFTLKGELGQEGGARQAGESGRRGPNASQPKEIGGWLHIGEDGAVTVFTGKVEVGQDIRTSLAQAVAEELRVPMASIKLVMGDTDLTPYDMGTFGSRTTPTMAPQLRKAAAAARELLLDLAAEQMKADRSALTADDGKISNLKTKQALSYGQLAHGQKLMKQISDDVPTTPADKWKVAGQSAHKVDGRDFVTGKHQYTSDMKQPGMLYGKIVRPSAFNATLVSADSKAAEALAGVTVVKDDNFIGVAATDAALAAQAVKLIKAEWKSADQPSSRELFDYLKAHKTEAQGNEGNSATVRGSIAEGLAAAEKRLQQTYTVAYIAHCPLEPRAALAEWSGDALTVASRNPLVVQKVLAEVIPVLKTTNESAAAGLNSALLPTRYLKVSGTVPGRSKRNERSFGDSVDAAPCSVSEARPFLPITSAISPLAVTW